MSKVDSTVPQILLKYKCRKCGLISEHPRLKHRRTTCPSCKRKTMHMLLAAPGAAVPTPGAPAKAGVSVTHVPVILAPEPGEGGVGAKEEGHEEVPAVEGIPDADTMTDLYKVVPEAIALGLQAPQVQLPEESCRVQGIRLARYCQRHNIVLPPWLDAVPIASRAIGDYTKFATDLSVAVKERKERKKEEKTAKATEGAPPKGITIPESSVEHVAAGAPGVPADFDIDKALKRIDHRGK